MKVLQINAVYGFKSTGEIVKDIGNALKVSGGTPYFAYQSCKQKPENGYQVGNKFDWKWHALYTRIFGKQAYASKVATKKLLRWIDENSPDVVHLHNLHSNYINLNMLLNYLAKKDVATVISLHDCWYFTGKCFHFIDVGCEGFTKGCGGCPKKKESPRSLFCDTSHAVLKDKQKYLSKIPRLSIVASSKWVGGEAQKGIFKNFDMPLIYNGVNVDIFKPNDKNVLKEKYGEDCYFVLGMANKWLLPENKQVLEEVVKLLNDKFKLVLIGCTDSQIKDLQEKTSNIIPVGFIKDRKELAYYYSSANVFVNVTHADTLPTVNMESICCGTPVITYDSCGSPELVLDGCGKIVRENDIEGIIDLIKSKPGKIDNESLLSARQKYDSNECYKKYLQVYSNLVKQKDIKC